MVPDPQAPDQNMPDVAADRRGWYPRWWILAALPGCLIILTVMFLWEPLICPPLLPNQAFLCQVVTWYSFVQVLLIWLFLLLLWVGLMSIGIGMVEVSRPKPHPLGELMRSLSEFNSVRYMLLLQGLIALVIVHLLWWLGSSPALAFALLWVVVFIAHSCHFHRLSPVERRGWLIGYGVLALMALAAELSFRRGFFTHWPAQDEWSLLSTQALIVIVGVIAFFRRPQLAPNLTPQQIRDQNVSRAAAPGFILQRMFRYLFPQRVAGYNPGNQPDNGRNPPPHMP